MYESFYGLKEKPFSMLPDPGFLYLSKKHQKALTLFEYGLMNHAGFCVISGEIGSGKTTLLRKLLENMNHKIRVGMITNTHQDFGNLLDWVLSAFDIHEKGLNEVEKHQRFVDFLIEQYAAKRHTMLIVDEAQNMSASKLEELRMLSNINADKDQILQIILAGQPELKDTLGLPELKQFVQRIAVDYHLDALDQDDTRGYIAHRLSVAGANHPIFTEAASDLIHKYSGGIPRLINLLCDTAMVYGFADQLAEIDEDLVVDMLLERMQGSLVPLACTEMPKKKVGTRIAAKKTADSTGISQTIAAGVTIQESETEPESSSENETDESKAPEESAGINQAAEIPAPDHGIEEHVSEQAISEAVQVRVSPEPETGAPAAIDDAAPDKSPRLRFFNPILMTLLALVMATLFYALSLEDDKSGSGAVAIEQNQSSVQPDLIKRASPVAEPSPDQANEQPLPVSIKRQLDETLKIQQEMAKRQRQDRARMKILEQKATQMQIERDAALAKMEAEKARRAAQAKAARIAAEREQEAQKIAQIAIAEAMAAANKLKLMEEVKANEARLQAEREEQDEQDEQDEQEKLNAAENLEAEKARKKASKARIEMLCQGSTARFLSTCR